MAAGSLLALIDDIASVLDDVALLTKVAAKKTSGVLGDDLAVNAEQVAGVNADRELPVIWARCQGVFSQQGHSGASRPVGQHRAALVGDAAAHGGRRIPVFLWASAASLSLVWASSRDCFLI